MDINDRFKDYKRIVIKVGTSTITYPNGKLNLKMMLDAFRFEEQR